MTAQLCDKFGFFNGVYGIEQSNWANYWRGIIPDGVIAGFGDELEVYAQGDGMRVYVKTGQAMVDNHRVWVNSQKELDVSAADGSLDRIDLVVLRVVYGNSGLSKAYADVKAGTPAADPQPPALTQVTGGTYEIPLAEVFVGQGVVTIGSSAVTDRRSVFSIPKDTAETFSGTTVTPGCDREYRNNTGINSLTVYLPQDPQETFITSVCFTASASFTAVTVYRGVNVISGTTNLKLKGDALTMPGKRYNLVFWWDGASYWCASGAV